MALLGEGGQAGADIAIGGVDALDVRKKTDRLVDLAGHLEREGQFVPQSGSGIGGKIGGDQSFLVPLRRFHVLPEFVGADADHRRRSGIHRWLR